MAPVEAKKRPQYGAVLSVDVPGRDLVTVSGLIAGKHRPVAAALGRLAVAAALGQIGEGQGSRIGEVADAGIFARLSNAYPNARIALGLIGDGKGSHSPIFARAYAGDDRFALGLIGDGKGIFARVLKAYPTAGEAAHEGIFAHLVKAAKEGTVFTLCPISDSTEARVLNEAAQEGNIFPSVVNPIPVAGVAGKGEAAINSTACFRALDGEAYTRTKEGAFPGVASSKERLARGLAGVLLSWEDGKRWVLGLPAVLLTDDEGCGLGLPAVLLAEDDVKGRLIVRNELPKSSKAASSHYQGAVKLGPFGARAWTVASKIPLTGHLFGPATMGSRRAYSSRGINELDSEVARLKLEADDLKHRVVRLEVSELTLRNYRKKVNLLCKCAGVGALFVSGVFFIYIKEIQGVVSRALVEAGKDHLKKKFWTGVSTAGEGVAEGARRGINAITFGKYGLSEKEKRERRDKEKADKLAKIKKEKDGEIREKQRLARKNEWIENNFALFRKAYPYMSEDTARVCYRLRFKMMQYVVTGRRDERFKFRRTTMSYDYAFDKHANEKIGWRNYLEEERMKRMLEEEKFQRMLARDQLDRLK